MPPFMMISGASRGIARGPSADQGGGSPITLPSRWGSYGDSQTGGRATETSSTYPMKCFRTLWDSSGYTSPVQQVNNGVGGRSLANSRIAYQGDTYASTPWIHVQESGDQNNDGQRTASEWGATFQAFMEEIAADHPGAIISYETAYSFSDARKAQPYRNWDTYNTELRSRVATLAGNGITVHIVETEYYILLAVGSLTYDVVCFPDGESNAYHYQGIGNFVIALAIFKALGYDVTTLDQSSFTDLNSTQRATVTSLVANN